MWCDMLYHWTPHDDSARVWWIDRLRSGFADPAEGGLEAFGELVGVAFPLESQDGQPRLLAEQKCARPDDLDLGILSQHIDDIIHLVMVQDKRSVGQHRAAGAAVKVKGMFDAR